MYSYIKRNKILLIIVLAALMLCVFTVGRRMGVEAEAKKYDVVLDYKELKNMAEQSEHDLSWWLGKFKEKGINKVGLTETSIRSLIQDTEYNVSGEVMQNVLERFDWEEDYPESFVNRIKARGYDKFDLLIAAKGDRIADFLESAVSERIDKSIFFTEREGDRLYIYIDEGPTDALYSESYKYLNSKNEGYLETSDFLGSKVFDVSLGFLPEEVELIQTAGCEIIPRTMSYKGWNDSRYAKAVLDGYEKYGLSPEYIIVGGQAVVGYDDGNELILQYLRDKGSSIALIEDTTQRQNIVQDGVEETVEASGYNAVRVFSVWDYIRFRYQFYGYPGAEEIENTLFRAISERNIRVIYFKTFFENKDLRTYITDWEDYDKLFDSLNSRLARHGISLGGASVMEAISVPLIAKIFMGFGCVAAMLLLLESIFALKRKHFIALGILGCAGVLGAAFVAPNSYELLLSFAACVIFGCLALTVYTAYAKRAEEELGKDAPLSRIFAAAGVALITAVVVALAGAMFVCAPLSSINYMLEIDIFRGVKAGQLLPIAYFAIAFLAYFGFPGNKTGRARLEIADIKSVLGIDLKLWMVLAAAVLLLAGNYYIARTGHETAVEVTNLEMIFRNKLEDIMIARPRTKEFLIAFPAIMLMMYCAARRLKLWSALFGLVGVLGVTSVINTFEHIRTPMYLGLYRVALSLAFGLILGAIAILIFDALYRLYGKYLKRYIEAADEKV